MSRASQHLVEQAKAFHEFAMTMQRAVGHEPSNASIRRVKQWIWESVNLGYSPVLLPATPIEVPADRRRTETEEAV